MKLQKLIKLIIIITFFNCSAFATSIYDTGSSKFISKTQLLNELPSTTNIILGEYHDTESIQNEQAQFINDFVIHKSLESNFTVAWEFLDFEDHIKTKRSFSKFKRDEINNEEMLQELKGDNANQYSTYLKIFETTKNLNGELIGLNARRSIKKEIVKNGIDSIEQTLIPPNMAIGGDNYYERFEISSRSMGRPPHLTYPMFVAQSYTDSVMANSLQEYSTFISRFIIVGCFHSDYLDGFSKQLQDNSFLPTVTMKIVNIDQISRETMNEMLKGHPKYGAIADYIFFLD